MDRGNESIGGLRTHGDTFEPDEMVVEVVPVKIPPLNLQEFRYDTRNVGVETIVLSSEGGMGGPSRIPPVQPVCPG